MYNYFLEKKNSCSYIKNRKKKRNKLQTLVHDSLAVLHLNKIHHTIYSLHILYYIIVCRGDVVG